MKIVSFATTTIAMCQKRQRETSLTSWRVLFILIAGLVLQNQATAFDLVNAKGQPASKKALREAVKKSRVVYIGEEHGTASHHLFQRQVLKMLNEQGPTVLGVEYFSPKHQPTLDDFVAGKISLQDFPEKIQWKKFWGHNWKAYKPLFAYAQKHKIRIVGLNAPRSLVRKVSRTSLKKMDIADLLMLPQMNLKDEAHRTRVIEQLRKVHPMTDKQLARYYEVFTLWDEYMAHSVARVFLNDRRPKLKMLVVAGHAHITTGTGIPSRVNRRFAHKALIIVCGTPIRRPEWVFEPKRAKLY